MSALPRPPLAAGPHQDLNDALHALHHRAGWPSLRSMAARVGCSHTTVSTAFSGDRIPSWGLLELLVEVLGGDVEEFRRRWLDASSAGAPPGPADAGATPGPAAPAIAGRSTELTLVRDHLRESRGGLLLVLGEAGIGKTRLVRTAAGGVDPAHVAWGCCLPLSVDVPLLPVTDALRSVQQVDGGRWLGEALATCAPYVPVALRRLLPELSPEPPEAAAVDLEPEDPWSRHRLFSAVSAVLTALGALRPLAVVLEDVHWADPVTLDLVEHLQVSGSAVPMVATSRVADAVLPGASAEWLVRQRRLSSVRALSLGALSLEETAEQLRLLGGGPAEPARVAAIHRRSEGHPLFTEQLAAQDCGDDAGAEDRPLPMLLAELLDRRIAGLGSPGQAVVEALGVADRSLGDRTLLDVTGLPADDLVAGLRELSGRGLLRPGRGPEVQLRHPLLAEAVRRGLVRQQIVQLHRRVAVALADSPSPSAAEVAAHWERGEQPAQEVVWRIRAAREAGTRFALEQEAEQWCRVLELWPPGVERLGAPGLRKHDAFLAAITALEFIDVPAALTIAEAALAQVSDPGGPDAAELYRRTADLRGYLGDWEEALRLLDDAIGIYESAPLSAGYVRALGSREYLLSSLGRDEEAAATNARALEVCARLGDSSLHRIRLAVQALYDAMAGAPGLALTRIRRAARLEVGRVDPRGTLYVAATHTLILLMLSAGPDEVAAAARPGLDAAAAWELDIWPVSALRNNVARAMRLAGQVDRAARLVDPFSTGDPTHVRAGDHDERAHLDLLRGRLAEATRRFEALAAFPPNGLYNQVEFDEHVVEADLWCGRPAPALERALRTVRRAVGTTATTYLGGLLLLAARAAADLAETGVPDARRRELADELDDLRARSRSDPFAPHPTIAARPALAAGWAAERARLDGEPSIEGWAAAAREWDRLARPHDAAYCRWRAAQVALDTGQATLARRLLARAARDSAQHVPLSTAIRATQQAVRPGAVLA